MLKYSNEKNVGETSENTIKKLEMENIYDLWILLMLCAKCQEITYLLNVFHSTYSFYGFIGRFMEQQRNGRASGSTHNITSG